MNDKTEERSLHEVLVELKSLMDVDTVAMHVPENYNEFLAVTNGYLEAIDELDRQHWLPFRNNLCKLIHKARSDRQAKQITEELKQLDMEWDEKNPSAFQ